MAGGVLFYAVQKEKALKCKTTLSKKRCLVAFLKAFLKMILSIIVLKISDVVENILLCNSCIITECFMVE